MRANDKAGTISIIDGIEYPHIKLFHHVYRADHLKHLWVTGEWPKPTKTEFGYYSKATGKYHAQCTRSGVTQYLGTFDTREEANAAYKAYAASVDQ
jgi:hypothetical protein